jgi:CheY-like chemotaxis protein
MNEKQQISVLIIEDDPMFRSLAFHVFTGFNKIIASNAREGLERFKEFVPNITLLDIGLPDRNGLDLLSDLIAYDPEAFIVMLTASALSSDVETAKKRGAAGYIIKPFTYKKVEDCLVIYDQYRKKLKELSPEQRADNFIKELKIKALDDAVKKHEEEKEEQHKLALYKELATWNILFVDTSETNRNRAQIQLKKLGCEVDIASNGSEVLMMTEAKYYDMIFMDAHTPKTDGYEATRILRQEKYGSKEGLCIIIGMIESTKEAKQQLWKDAGMDNFVPKPTTFSQLRKMIDKYIEMRVGSKAGV